MPAECCNYLFLVSIGKIELFRFEGVVGFVMQKGKTSFRRVWGAGAQKKSKVKSVTGRNGHGVYIFSSAVWIYDSVCVCAW